MKVYLRCQCFKKVGKKRNVRVNGCDHKWACDFKVDGKKTPPIMTPFRNGKEAARWGDRYRENYLRHKHGRPLVEDDTADCFRNAANPAQRPQTVRLADLQTQFEDWAPGALPKTAKKYLPVVRSFVHFVGETELLHTIVPFHIERWRLARVKELARNGRGWQTKTAERMKNPRMVRRTTVNTNLVALRTFFRQAQIWYAFPSPFTPIYNAEGKKRSPISKWKIGKGEKKRIVPLSPQEVDETTAKLPYLHGLVCRITYITLARLGEVLALERSHVGTVIGKDGLLQGWMQREVKGSEDPKRSWIPLILAEELLAVIAALPEQERRIFHTIDPETASSTFRRLFDQQGKPWSHHWFRHSGITTMKDRGDVNDAAIVEMAGWTSAAQLGTYNHVSDRAVAHAGDGNLALLSAARAARDGKPQEAEALIAAAQHQIANLEQQIARLQAQLRGAA